MRRSYRYGLVHVSSRSELPAILEARGLVGEGAEIGVHKGSFSEYLLENWKGRKLHSIDPWQESEKEICADGSSVSQDDHDHLYSVAVKRLERFGTRSALIRRTSAEAVHCFADGQLDFVWFMLV